MSAAIQIMRATKFLPVRLIVEAGVRYWEDAEVDGDADEDGSRIPLRHGDLWRPAIELESGHIRDWPQGRTASVHYKVCDAGEYWLENTEGERVKWRGSYVPTDLLCVGDDGYGDYIILEIGGDGKIQGWKTPTLNSEEWEAVES